MNASIEGAPGAAETRTADRATVLVVDDEAVLRVVAQRVLGLAGYRVLVAGSGEEAQAIVRDEPRIDVLFSDIMMPGIRGTALARWLRDVRPAARVLLTSGYTAEEISDGGDTLGGRAFLPKPYAPAQLTEAIRRLLEEPSGS